jgi:hypothetical protein
VVLKISGRDSVYMNRELHSKTLGTSSRREKRRIVAGIKDLLNGVLGGTEAGNLWVTVLDNAGAKPTWTVTCTQATSADGTLTFTYGGIAIVVTEGVDYEQGASDTSMALALATFLNAHPILGGILTCTPAVGVVTAVSKVPTSLLEDLAIVGDTGIVVADTVAGTEGAAQLFLQHIDMGQTP